MNFLKKIRKLLLRDSFLAFDSRSNVLKDIFLGFCEGVLETFHRGRGFFAAKGNRYLRNEE